MQTCVRFHPGTTGELVTNGRGLHSSTFQLNLSRF